MAVKRIVRVTIEKELEIELTDGMFGKFSEDEFIDIFNREMWEVKDMSDIVRYAAEMIALHGAGHEHDALGLVGRSHSTFPRIPDVKFDEIDSTVEVEFLDE